MYRTRPLDGVSVMSVLGRGTATDSNGNYVVTVRWEDSIFFSYLGRATAKYAVSGINSSTGFDIALHVDPTELREVRVMPKDYHMDSLQNRKDYEKYFNFKKPGVKVSGTNGNDGLGVGMDLNELINFFPVPADPSAGWPSSTGWWMKSRINLSTTGSTPRSCSRSPTSRVMRWTAL